ncbi:MAG TPA: hypothetical protein ENN12_04240 [Epsilonproteobacteria bacterium]|nr:hypothetical protein [Campylobacterota bacterium]
MFYYYAHTSHKANLDRLRRGVACINAFASQGIECKLLVNDFRAALVAKEQLGLRDALNIETIHDLDLVLKLNDSVIIDSNEELPLGFERFCKDYKVFIIAPDCDTKPLYNEVVINPWSQNGLFVDSAYGTKTPKIDRVLFFGGDSDPQKEISKYLEPLQKIGAQLLLGHYFFIDYEQELKKSFEYVYESEEYQDIIPSSSHVVTTSLQCALEAKTTGAIVGYAPKAPLQKCILTMLKKFEIDLINLSDINSMDNLISKTIKFDNQVTNSISCDIFSLFQEQIL